MRHVIWFGPVSSAQRRGATVEGASEHFLTCTGDGSDGGARCRARAEAWRDADGRHVPGMLRELGIADGEELFLGAFSAGGQIVKVIFEHPDDRAAVRGVLLADGTYEIKGVDGRPASTPAFVDYIIEAVTADRFFFASASSSPNNMGGTEEPSGSVTLERIVADVEERLGRRFEQQSGLALDGTDLRPARVWSLGPNVRLADFGGQYRHEQHATQIAPVVWPALLQPWLDGRLAPGEGAAAPAPAPGPPAPAAGEDDGGAVVEVGGAVTVLAALAIAGLVAYTRRPS